MTESELTLPQDVDAERILLSTLAQDGPYNPETPEVFQIINGGQAFISPANRSIYLALKSAIESGLEPHAVNIKAEMEAQGTLERAGGFQAIVDATGAMEVVHPLVLARRIVDLANRRQLMKVGAALLNRAQDATIPLSEVLKEFEDIEALRGGVTGVTPLRVVGARMLLDAPDEDPKFLVQGVFPQALPCVLASQGGLGKSFLMLMAGVAWATGKAWLDFPAHHEPVGVVYLSMEDDEATVSHRIKAIRRRFQEWYSWSDEDEANLERNFRSVWVDWKVKGASANLHALAPHLSSTLASMARDGIRPGGLILDTLARVSEGDENTVQALRPVVNACTQIASDSGYTPIVLHHMSKGQGGARTKEKPTLVERMDPEWIRGSSAIVDNFRCTVQCVKIREDEADPAGLDPDKAKRGGYMVLGVSKLNRGAMADWRFLEQDENGLWFIPQDAPETLARLRGKKAVVALTKQNALLLDVYQATRWGGAPDVEAISKRHFGEMKDPKNAFRQSIHRMRHAGLIQKNSYQLTVLGLERVKGVTAVTDEGCQNE